MDSKTKEPPYHVLALAKGGHVCKSCGGEVDEAGFGYGGEVDTPQAKELSAEEKKALYEKARARK